MENEGNKLSENTKNQQWIQMISELAEANIIIGHKRDEYTKLFIDYDNIPMEEEVNFAEDMKKMIISVFNQLNIRAEGKSSLRMVREEMKEVLDYIDDEIEKNEE